MIVDQLARDGSLRAELEPTIAADLLTAGKRSSATKATALK
jgi:hypothetical protein